MRLAALLLAASAAFAGPPPPLPAPAANPLISRIALGSCLKSDRPAPVLETAAKSRADLFVWLGDNIYGDTRDMALLEAKYRVLGAMPEFAALAAGTPMVATWDDHDYGENDAGRDYPMKEQSKEIFLRFWNEPADSPRRKRPGIHTSHTFTDPALGKTLQIILLDTRTFRTPLSRNRFSSYRNDYHPDPNPANTFLGEEQWAWLGERLREPADLRLIGTSIQFAHEHNGYESWTNFPSEIARMMKLIRDTRANGVVFLSGDVHWAELSVLQPKGFYPVHDLTSSGINQHWDKIEPNQNRLGQPCRDHHFGLLEVDWKAAEPSLTFLIRDVKGADRIRHTVRLADLRFKD